MGILGRVPPGTPHPQMKHNPLASKLDVRHVLAALVGVICFAVVYVYSGDSELLIAFTSGLVGSAASYLVANIAIAARNSTG